MADLTCTMIDWLISTIEDESVQFDGTCIRYAPAQFSDEGLYSPSSDPCIGHPILEREKIQLRFIESDGHPMDGLWIAQDCRFRAASKSVEWSKYGTTYPDLDLGYLSGPTMLIAGLRFVIAKHLVGKCENPKVMVPAKLKAKKSSKSNLKSPA